MPKPPLPDEVAALLSKPNPSVIATLRSSGQPVTVATWYLWEDGRVLVNMDQSRVRLQHLRRDPRVSITVLAEGDWYTHVSMQGHVTDIHDDDGMVDIDRISRHYTGNPYPHRDNGRVSAWIEIDRWHGWGATADS